MRSATAVAALALWVVAGVAAAGEEAGTTTVFVVRHAEKSAEPGDPPLDAAGERRAKELVRVLADVGVDALIATQFRRTRETLLPLAQERGLEVGSLPVDAADLTAQSRDVARMILDRHRGGTVVVAGHSNTVPLLLAALGVDDPPILTETDYDDLFVVTIAPGGDRRLIHLHYGETSP